MAGLGYGTDLFFERRSGVVEEHEHFFAVRHPDDPGYYFGNYLLLKSPPKGDDRDRLERAFGEHVGGPPEIKHFTFCWTPEGGDDVGPFVEAGYDHERWSVLAAEERDLRRPGRTNGLIAVRAFDSDADWDAWAELELSERDEAWSPESYEVHLQEQLGLYRALADEGRGNWYGAFIGGELVGGLGLFFDGRVGRFQDVLTKESHRNRAICKTLVYGVSRLGFGRANELVMVADEDYHAARIYESLGFVPRETQASLCWWPKEEASP